MFGIAHQSTIITAGINIFLAFYVLLKTNGWNRALNRYFSILSFGFALWNLGMAFNASSMIYIGVFLFLPAFYAFLLTLLRQFNPQERLYAFLICIVSGFSILTSVYFFAGSSPPAIIQHALNAILITISIPVFLWGIYRLNNSIRIGRSFRERSRMMFILVGLIAAACAGIFGGLTVFGLNLVPWSAIAGLIYTISIAIAVMRHRLIDTGQFVSRLIMILILSLILWVLFGILGHFDLDKKPLTFVSMLAVTLAVVMLYEPLKSFVEGQTFRVLSSDAAEFMDDLNRFGRDINNFLDEESMIRDFARLLHQSPRIQSFGIYTTDTSQNTLVFHDGKDTRRQPASITPVPALLVETLKSRRGPISRNQLAIELRAGLPRHLQDERIQLYRIMNRLRISEAFPFLCGEHFYGFVSVGLEDPEIDLTRTERSILFGITCQFAAALTHMHLEKLYRTREHLATLGRLASGLAHEIRNPLATIKAGVQYLEQDGFNIEAGEFLSIIRDEVDRLERFVYHFLDYARPSHQQKQQLKKPLEDILNKIKTTSLSRPKPPHGHLEIHIDPKAAGLELPEDPWIQILNNLLTNAFCAIEPQGTVQIKANLANTVEMLEISIEDSGPGIPEEEWQIIFEPFYSKRHGGIGLGLAIVQNIIQGMNGNISCAHSTLGGAAFLIRVPLD